MAIDTRAKRFSMLNFSEGDCLLPDADGSFDSADRAFLLGLYAGISLSAVPTVPGLEFTLPENRMHFDVLENRMQYTLPVNRMHFVMSQED